MATVFATPVGPTARGQIPPVEPRIEAAHAQIDLKPVDKGAVYPLVTDEQRQRLIGHRSLLFAYSAAFDEVRDDQTDDQPADREREGVIGADERVREVEETLVEWRGFQPHQAPADQP